jgi:hypothetical protein
MLARKKGDEALRHAFRGSGAPSEPLRRAAERLRGEDFAEITALHFGFVKMEEAYAKAQKKASPL